MSEHPTWLQVTTDDPGHSHAYVQRFRRLAEQGQDLAGEAEVAAAEEVPPDPVARWWPGQDVRHDELGPGWVWGRGLGRVTVRFEGPLTAPGPVRTLAADDPLLQPADPPDWRTPE